MKKIDGFFEKYWRFLHLIVCVYLAANYFKLWERWRAYWVVHIIMAVFFFCLWQVLAPVCRKNANG